MALHVTWTQETHDGRCGVCGSAVVLVLASPDWSADQNSNQYEDGIDIQAEVSGHWCPECDCLTSLSLNQD